MSVDYISTLPIGSNEKSEATKILANRYLDLYTFTSVWSEEDSEYVGLCRELPSLSWLDIDQDKALAGIIKLVSDVIFEMIYQGENIPEPTS